METLKFYEGGYNPEKEYILYKSLEDGKFKLEYYRVLTTTPSTNHTHANKDILDKITDEKILYWDGKSEFDGDYESLINKPNIPSKTSDLTNDSDFVTTTEMNTAIANAQIGSGTEIDTSNFATKDELRTKVDKKTGYSLVADSEITRLSSVSNYDDTGIKKSLSNKSDINHTHSYNNLTDKPSIPSIDGLATETFVTNKIAEAQLAQGEIDLSGYATKDDLNIKADKSELHSHDNKTILDGITSDKVSSWDNKSNFSGSYNDLTNKPTIPTKTSQLTNDSGYVTNASLHSHTNKAVLDGITADKVSEWNNKSDFSGDYNDLTNKPSIPTVDVNKSYVDTALSKKVDKKTGYSLVADSEIERLANVDNYDDTEIKNELSKKANSSDLHSHSNKTVLDGITANKVSEWNNKSTFSGNYNDLTNKPTIPTKTSQLTNDSNFATTSQLHNHTNKTVLDDITLDKIESWDSKSTFSGSYNDLTDKPTIPVVDSSLSTTSTNAIQNKVVTNALNNKANSSHSHTITNITNLQTSLDRKSDVGHTHSYNDLSDKPTIPTVDVTKSYVDAGLNKKVDKKTGYSLIADSEIERLSGVDNYDDTAIKASINTKANSSDVYTKTQTDNLLSTKANKTDLHSHSNKAVLDSITEEKLTEWDNKSDFSGSYNDLTNKPTIPVVDSALSLTSTNAIQNKVVKTALDGKANSSHTHSISNITDLQTALDSKSDTSHTHNYAGSSSVGGEATSALACSGNAATATKLQTARTINGTSFNGSANITTNIWGTARNITIGNTTKSINGSTNISWTLEEIGTSGVAEVSTVAELKSALTKGGTIHVKGGEYVLGENEELEYYSNTKLIGIGDVVIKVNPASASYIALKPHLDGTETGYTGVHNVTIENITMDGQAGTNNYGLFATAHCKNIDIKNCTFKNYCGRWHLVEINSSQNVKMTNCDITDYNYNLDSTDMFCTEAVQLDFAGDQGNYPFTCNLDNTGCQNITFESCNFKRIKTSWTAAVGSHTITEAYMPTNVTFTRCTFEDIDNCIYAPDFKNLVCDTCTIINAASFVIMHPSSRQNRSSCKIDNCDYSGWSRSKTIGYMNNTPEGRFFFQLAPENELSASKITNNTILGAYSHAIGISPNAATITGNSVKYSGKHGIYLYGGSQTTITGNSAVGNGTLEGYTGYDIYISVGSLGYIKRCNVSNNASYVNTDGNTYESTRIADNL